MWAKCQAGFSRGQRAGIGRPLATQGCTRATTRDHVWAAATQQAWAPLVGGMPPGVHGISSLSRPQALQEKMFSCPPLAPTASSAPLSPDPVAPAPAFCRPFSLVHAGLPATLPVQASVLGGPTLPSMPTLSVPPHNKPSHSPLACSLPRPPTPVVLSQAQLP